MDTLCMKPTQENTGGQDDDVMAGWTGVQSLSDQDKSQPAITQFSARTEKGRTGHGATAELNFARVVASLTVMKTVIGCLWKEKGGCSMACSRI